MKNLLQRKAKSERASDPNRQGAWSVEFWDLYEQTVKHLTVALDLAKTEDLVLVNLESLSELAEVETVVGFRKPSSLRKARRYLEEMERLLSYFPIAARLVEFQRRKAKLAELEGRFDSAVRMLKAGRRIALEQDDLFRACDCDYQLGHLVLRALRSDQALPDLAIMEGIRALERAVQYYELNVSTENIYYQNCVRALADLREVQH